MEYPHKITCESPILLLNIPGELYVLRRYILQKQLVRHYLIEYIFNVPPFLVINVSHSCLVNLMPTQNLLRMLLLLMLMLRIMLATVCYRFGSWRLVLKLNFCSDFEHKGWSRFWSWGSGKILKLDFVQHFAADVL